MFIIDYGNEHSGDNCLTDICKTESEVIAWLAEQSVSWVSFKVVRLNRYEDGTLTPYEIFFGERSHNAARKKKIHLIQRQLIRWNTNNPN